MVHSRRHAMWTRVICLLGLLLFLLGSSGWAATSSPLFARGYTVLPAPQKVSLGTKDFEFKRGWRLELGPGIKPEDIAVQSLKEELKDRFQLTLGVPGSAEGVVHLAMAPNAVTIGTATDANKAALAEQAYRMELASDRVTVTGNTTTGVFYGVQTLVQLLKLENGRLWLPESQIQDWPDLELRVIYWDDAHHLEHPDVLRAALRQASFYKINGLSIKLEGHFQYQHAPAIVEPYALTPAELQELTNYALKYHVQLIPYLDGPAHDAFILKHPEYAKLREYPDNNYEFCSTNPEMYQLFEGMFQDLLAANQGGKYFVLSTDEPYYVGLANNEQCHEAERAKQLGSVGKLLAEFVTKTAGFLHDHGRTVIFWGEYPLKPDDIGALPNYVVNGEMYGPQFDPVFRAHGIKQMIYTSTEGEEQLFPQYYILPSSERLHPRAIGPSRVQEMWEHASFTSLDSLSSTRPDFAQANQADVIGELVAGWADPGLHPETFWLGYAAGPAAAWHRGTPSPKELESSFYQLFYGSGTTTMGRLYQLMSEQAQFWEDSWETGPSAARSPIWGNSYGIFNPPRPAHDQYLPLLPVPAPALLHLGYDWRLENQKRLELAGKFLAQNDQLIDLLQTNIARVHLNRYNLEVYLSIAGLYRQNLIMLHDLGRISDALKTAEMAAGRAEAERAVASLDRAINIAENIREHRNQALQNTTATWYETWFPRVKEGNGRRYFDQVDDVKDHQPVRTVDMSYLVYRELLYPLDDWANQVIAARNGYAGAHKLALRNYSFDWKETSSTVTTARTADESTD
ncbi:MAG: glycoside hydrolase family 20 zincin-like fold domain-containing protein [Bryobacteraceae bacterium]